jgi:hypothetical protein
MKRTYYTYETRYTNETGERVLLADGIEVLAVGEDEIRQKMAEYSEKGWVQDMSLSPWGVLEEVEPGQTVEHKMTAVHIIPEESDNAPTDRDLYFAYFGKLV